MEIFPPGLFVAAGATVAMAPAKRGAVNSDLIRLRDHRSPETENHPASNQSKDKDDVTVSK